ncbi:MAG: hypothetical protein GY697_14015 [Desulfobacterales bacterium]|nr:hypothetical protein [Desulfobacterales bacterium]
MRKGFFSMTMALSAAVLTVAVCWAMGVDTFGLGAIGRKIYANECGSKPENLITWNRGEDFISLGIGHFIWYPQGQSGPYTESFLTFTRYALHRKVSLPRMLAGDPMPGCPWPDRTAYLAAGNSVEAQTLRAFLEETIPLQTRFLLIRLERALPRMLKATLRNRQSEVEKKFYRIARSARGRYALVDYVNFKGEGISPTERIAGQGWGLLQVLEDMDPQKSLVDAETEFAAAAERVLTRRANADPRPHVRQSWLPGWTRRVRTYTDP